MVQSHDSNCDCRKSLHAVMLQYHFRPVQCYIQNHDFWEKYVRWEPDAVGQYKVYMTESVKLEGGNFRLWWESPRAPHPLCETLPVCALYRGWRSLWPCDMCSADIIVLHVHSLYWDSSHYDRASWSTLLVSCQPLFKNFMWAGDNYSLFKCYVVMGVWLPGTTG